MHATVTATDDPRQVLQEARDFLVSDPVRHNVIMTILENRAATGEPGRWWLSLLDGRVAGLAFQSPLTFLAGVAPMPDELVPVLVDAIASAGVRLPGVIGMAHTAARFAGEWTQVCKSAAVPVQGQRIYEVAEVIRPDGVPGAMAAGQPSDRDLVIEWTNGFHGRMPHHEPDMDVGEYADRRLADGQVWLWQDGGRPVSMSVTSTPVAGVRRVQAVYTPPELRRNGYAAACVAEISGQILAEGYRCILYTDLGNPTSNSVYRRIGYRAVAEGVRYEFR